MSTYSFLLIIFILPIFDHIEFIFYIFYIPFKTVAHPVIDMYHYKNWTNVRRYGFVSTGSLLNISE